MGGDGCFVGCYDTEGICGVDRLPCPGDPPLEELEDAHFRCIACDQVKGMNRSMLADPIDAPGSLLEAYWVPRQLEIDDHTTVLMEIEPFSSRVSGQEDRLPPTKEVLQCRSTFASVQATMKHRTGKRK